MIVFKTFAGADDPARFAQLTRSGSPDEPPVTSGDKIFTLSRILSHPATFLPRAYRPQAKTSNFRRAPTFS